MSSTAPRFATASVVVAAIVFAGTIGAAQAASTDADRQALLMLRVLAYDRNLSKRAEQTVTVAVLHRPTDETSTRCGKQLTKILDRVSQKVKVLGKPVRPLLVAYQGSNSLGALLVESKVSTLWLCSGTSDIIADVTRQTRKHSVLSFTTSETDLRAGIAVGIIQRKGKPKIAINKPAALAEDAQFAAGLYRVAEIVE